LYGGDDDDRHQLLGTMLCRRDLGLSCRINLRDFSNGMLMTIFVAAGCDRPYRDLVSRRDALYRVMGVPLVPDVAKDVAEGLVDPQ
jgi:hypothetical protein